MNKQEAIFRIKELQKTYASMDRKVAEAVDIAIEALSDPHNCAGCKYEEMWSKACEKCSRPMIDNYVKEGDSE